MATQMRGLLYFDCELILVPLLVLAKITLERDREDKLH